MQKAVRPRLHLGQGGPEPGPEIGGRLGGEVPKEMGEGGVQGAGAVGAGERGLAVRRLPPAEEGEDAAVPDLGGATCQEATLHGGRLLGGELGKGEEGAGSVETHGGHDFP